MLSVIKTPFLHKAGSGVAQTLRTTLCSLPLLLVGSKVLTIILGWHSCLVEYEELNATVKLFNNILFNPFLENGYAEIDQFVLGLTLGYSLRPIAKEICFPALFNGFGNWLLSSRFICNIYRRLFDKFHCKFFVLHRSKRLN